MATSVVQICNIALGRIGVDQLIEDIEDRNDRARNCKLHYEPCRQQVLQDFPWNFARAVVPLAELSGDPPPGWGYAYRYPTDCLDARAITDASGDRMQLSRVCVSWDSWVQSFQPRWPFSVMADTATDGARLIATDLPAAYLWYTKDVSAPTQFTPLFASALAWRLAAELAGPLRTDSNLRQAAENAYIWAVSQAQAHSLNEEEPDPPRDSPSIMARW